MDIENVKELLEAFSKNMDESSDDYYKQIETLKQQKDEGSEVKDRKYIDTGFTPSYEDVFGALYKGGASKVSRKANELLPSSS